MSDNDVRAVLVIGGTSRLHHLLSLRKRGVRIVQRLNGMNWMHRQRRSGLRHTLRSEYNNRILALIRRHLADAIVYQSSFSRDWWHAVWGDSRKPETVVYNGVDLDEFSPPEAPAETTGAGLLMVEGNLGGGYEIGLENGLALTAELNRRGAPIQLSVAGNAPPSLRAKFPEREFPFLRWLGVVGHAKLAGLYRSSGLFFSGDLNAACPNAVIEALACGLPVAAYATGALPEMLAGQGGLCVPWGADFWKLEQAAVGPLADAAEELLRDAATWRVRARNRAEAAFDIRRTAVAYLDVLFG